MTKRPTFNDLIAAYGEAKYDVGVSDVTAVGNGNVVRERVILTRDALVRALRKAGVPLDQVAPQ